MPTYLLRPSIPSGVTFSGQLLYDMTAYQIPYDWRREIYSISVRYPSKFVNKLSGFETTKEQLNGVDSLAQVSIQFFASLQRNKGQFLTRMIEGIHRSGMALEFYDDIATNRIYIGKIGDHALDESNSIHSGGNIVLACYSISDI